MSKHKRTFVALITSINTTFSKRLRTYEYNANTRKLFYVVCFKYFRYSFFLCVFPLIIFPACYLRWVAIIFHFPKTSYVFSCCSVDIMSLHSGMNWIRNNHCLFTIVWLCYIKTSTYHTKNWHIIYLNERGDGKNYVCEH